MKQKENKVFAPFDISIYDNLLSEIKSKYNVLEYPTTFQYIQNINFLFRHDIDTLKCIESFEYLLEIDKKHHVKSGVYFRVDNDEYNLGDYKHKVLKYKELGFEIGLHTVCYVEDDYKKRFFEELDEFESALGFKASSFTVHGLGEYKLGNRNLFYDDVAQVGLDKYHMSFSDCCRKYMVYDKYIIDCNFDEKSQSRYINDDWFDLTNRLNNEHTILVMTHPCYWANND